MTYCKLHAPASPGSSFEYLSPPLSSIHCALGMIFRKAIILGHLWLFFKSDLHDFLWDVMEGLRCSSVHISGLIYTLTTQFPVCCSRMRPAFASFCTSGHVISLTISPSSPCVLNFLSYSSWRILLSHCRYVGMWKIINTWPCPKIGPMIGLKIF